MKRKHKRKKVYTFGQLKLKRVCREFIDKGGFIYITRQYDEAATMD